MVFSSLIFICRFLPAFMIIYMCCPKRGQNLVLFLGSLLFYSWGEPVYIGIMLFSTFLDYGNGRLLEKAFRSGRIDMARAVLTESVLVNLCLLGVFKYSGMFPLPIGISFYTFQTMSYTIDVYRRKVPAQKNLISFGAYVAMFPQLIAGPIVRYADVAEEIDGRRQTWEDGYEGIGKFCIGLGKKVLLANQIGLLWEQVQRIPAGEMSVLLAWTGSLAYALQLYFDFSGYSDMAVGLAQMMGFHLKENFNYPYRSRSITEFWRRWHISLGEWFREYVYIPLGGNRRGLAVQIRNILVVWSLTGIWHGKGWNFLAWGLYFGLLLTVEKFGLLRWLERHPATGHLYASAAVLAGMTIFAIPDLSQGIRWVAMMAGCAGCFFNARTAWILSNYGVLLLLGVIGAVGLGKRMSEKLPVRAAVFFLSVAYLVDAAYNPFLYFRF